MKDAVDVSYDVVRSLLLYVDLEEEEIYNLMESYGLPIEPDELIAVLADYDLVIRGGRIDVP